MVKRKKKNGIVTDITPPLVLAGGAMSSSVLGGALQKKLPSGATNPLTTAGSTLGGFVAPVSAISASGIAIRELHKTRKKVKSRRANSLFF